VCVCVCEGVRVCVREFWRTVFTLFLQSSAMFANLQNLCRISASKYCNKMLKYLQKPAG